MTQFEDMSTVPWQICHYLSSCSFLFPDKPFLTVSHKKGPYYEITSGHKSLKLAAKVDAFPRPSVTWWVPSSWAKSGIRDLLLGSCLGQTFTVPYHIQKRRELGMLMAVVSSSAKEMQLLPALTYAPWSWPCHTSFTCYFSLLVKQKRSLQEKWGFHWPWAQNRLEDSHRKLWGKSCQFSTISVARLQGGSA